jgi:hypothetical protein
LIFKGLSLLVYRHQPITPEEAAILGERGTHLVAYTREKVREALVTLLEGGSPGIGGGPGLLDELGEKKSEFFANILDNKSLSDEESKKDPLNTVALHNSTHRCRHCAQSDETHQSF